MAIEKVASMPEGPSRQQATKDLANFMKLCYLTWNTDTVNDDQIFRDLRRMSAGKIEVDITMSLNHSHELLPPVQKKNNNNKKRHKNRRHRR